MILATPLFIKNLGTHQYGLWVLLNTITQLMSIFNLGLGDANIKYISAYRGTSDFNAIRKIVSTTSSLTSIIALFSIACGTMLALVIYYKVIDISFPDIVAGAVCAQLAMVLFATKFAEVVLL